MELRDEMLGPDGQLDPEWIASDDAYKDHVIRSTISGEWRAEFNDWLEDALQDRTITPREYEIQKHGRREGSRRAAGRRQSVTRLYAFLCIAILAVILALDARAGWTTCPGSTAHTDTSWAVLSPGGRACLRQTTATDPPRIDATACRGGVDLTFQDPTAPNYDASVYVHQCAGSGNPGVFSDCKLVPIDRDGDAAGDGLPLTGDEAALQFGLWGLSPDWYAFDVTNGSSRTIELKAICR